MEWIKGLQKAIDYIELNIEDDDALDINKIASEANCSEQYFRKLFSIITNLTVSEYIRNRKLSMAGEELLHYDSKVIDIALKYGYETPESFTKAFTRFHGNTPSYIKQTGSGLKSFNRICLKISVEGGNILDYQIIKHPEIRLLCRTEFFDASSSEKNFIKLPNYVKQCYSDKKFTALSDLSNDEFTGKIMAYRDSVDCADDSIMRYNLGVAYDGEEIPEGYHIVKIPELLWIKFTCRGKRPKAIQELWYRVYTEFIPFSSYDLYEDITLEVSPFFYEGDISYLWIPVRQK